MEVMQNKPTFKYINEAHFKNLLNWSVGSIIGNKLHYKEGFTLEPIGNLIVRNRTKEIIEDEKFYKQVTIKLYGKGVIQRGDELIQGKDIGTKNQFRISEGQFIMSKIDARNGAFGIVPKELEGAITTQDFLSYNVNTDKILPEFFNLITGTSHFANLCQRASSGTTGRQRVNENEFLNFKIPLPIKVLQKQIIDEYYSLIAKVNEFESRFDLMEREKNSFLIDKLGLIENEKSSYNKKFYLQSFSNIGRWDVWNLSQNFKATKYQFKEFKTVVIGKPTYGANTKTLHQGSEIRYIRITDINENGYLNDEFVSAQKVENQYLLEDYDFLIARSGNTVGKTFLYRKEYGKAIYAGYLVKYRLNREKINPYYLLYYTKSKPFKNWIKSNQRISAQPNINGQEYLTAPIIVPPMNIQNEIVETLEKIYDGLKTLKYNISETKLTAIKKIESAIFNIE